jgi:Mg-chelatase subunit ChlD
VTFEEKLYKTSLIGALGGLLAWAVRAVLPVFIPRLQSLPQELYWISDFLDLALIGVFIGALYISFDEHIETQKFSVWQVAAGAVGGLASGAAGGWLLQRLGQKWAGHWFVPLLAWAITGATIGLVTGAIRHRLSLRRSLLSLVGGSVGAIIGGGIWLALGEWVPYLTHALGLMIAGAGVAFGSTLAMRLMRNALIKFAGSDDPRIASYFEERNQEWELVRGDRYLWGQSPAVPKSGKYNEYIHSPDENMAVWHAEVLEENKSFYLVPHEKNTAPPPDGTLYPLYISRSQQEIKVIKKERLESGDEIRMGNTKFIFLLRGRNGLRKAAVIMAATALAAIFFQTEARAQTAAQLAGADHIRLLQYEPGSERPCFRLTVNIVDKNGNVLEIPFLDPRKATGQTEVLEGDRQLEVCRVSSGEASLLRLAILLVDVSGSMNEPAPDGRTKFHAMKEACRRFAEDFADGIDQIAVIPFSSRDVLKGAEREIFLSRREELLSRILRIAEPRADANTALFSAALSALMRLRKAREEARASGRANPQCLLVVMTDGRNDVGNQGDDAGLLTDWQPVRRLADETGIQIITVGFGDSQHIDEQALRRLAWPKESNYIRARNTAGLIRAFQTARALQVRRLQITFFPQQALRGQLINEHQFKVRLNTDSGGAIEGVFPWTPRVTGVGGAPPFEGVISPDERCGAAGGIYIFRSWFVWYLGTLALCGWLLHFFWFTLYRWKWGDEHDRRVLLPRAISAVFDSHKPHR